MKRRTFDETNDQPVDDVDRNRLACSWCSKSTLRSVLSQYGARCFECFEGYCRRPQDHAQVGDKEVGPKGWAYALKRREVAGERLTGAQKAMWRTAIGESVDDSQGDPDEREAAKERTAARVAEYARQHGISLSRVQS